MLYSTGLKIIGSALLVILFCTACDPGYSSPDVGQPEAPGFDVGLEFAGRKGEALSSVNVSDMPGSGGQKIGFQSFAFDERTGAIYTLHLTGKTLGNKAIVNKFSSNARSFLRANESEGVLSDEVGHQGLGLEYLPGNDLRLWSTASQDSRQAVRYSYREGVGVSNVERYVLFGNDFYKRASSTPTISFDQKYILAIGRSKLTGSSVVRVWKLADLKRHGAADYSGTPTYEWSIDFPKKQRFPVQGIASDGVKVWILAGNNNIEDPKYLWAYSMRGALIGRKLDFSVGKAQAMEDGSGRVYEPEGLQVISENGRHLLCVGILSGDLGKRYSRIYKIPIDNEFAAKK
ncbi:hypothetical protein [Pseudomonas putida]|uniref:phage baseplate protein n=1 Tax=Pseudomonas putida TaxID=303 RepID=UPI0012D2D938|nr:hypothetical protein [Pseudomonas putida]